MIRIGPLHFCAAVGEDLEARLPARHSLRRASEASKAAVAAVSEALRAASAAATEGMGVYVGQQQIPLDYCREFIDASYRDGPRFASPMLFSESVANNAATHLSLTLGFKGSIQTFIGSRVAGIQAVAAAAQDLESGAVEAGLVVVLSFAGPLTSDAFNSLYAPRARRTRPPPLPFANGAAAFRVSRDAGGPGRSLSYAGTRCLGRTPQEQSRAVRELWEESRTRVPSGGPPPAASAFLLARERSLEIVRAAVGEVSTPEPAGESFALDPFLLLREAPPGPWSVVCLGEEGTAGLLAVT